MTKKYTITDVAQDLGVSCSTVSRALSDSSGVSEKVKQRIVEYAREIGYEPNSKMHQKENGSRAVALIIGDIRNPFYGELAYYIQRELNKNGYMMMLCNTEYSVDRELEVVGSLEKMGFAGAILMTAQVEKINEELERVRIPVVLVNRNLSSFQGDMVLLDNFKAGYVATMHLIEQAHRTIGFVKGHTSSSASRQRYEGYCQAMSNYGLVTREQDIYYSDMKIEAGEKIARQFLQNGNRPTGMVIVNDVTALGFVSTCIGMGVRVPEELSVVSFDNTKFAQWGMVPLTSVDQNTEKMGEQTVSILLKRIRNYQREAERVILSPELVVRSSTARYVRNRDER
ncbi:MAG: LacI family transcriptional regulator [Lachnospiraceae bacterium]|nr:LacI family transcriptional regulator [Lachnospiraceae bacterium]